MSTPAADMKTRARNPVPAWIGWLLPIGFAAVAAALLAAPPKCNIPIPPASVVDSSSLVVGPRRVAMIDPPRLLVEGVSEKCNACHQIFRSSHATGERPDFHTEVQLQHGLNNRCVNCHDPEDRERLTLRDGTTIAFAETPRLCSQCHGTVYRDWQRGTHGKTLGSWRTGAAEQHRLGCNECHDPHSPKYDPYVPLPGPNTLRMGEQEPAPHEPGSKKTSPLQRMLEDLNAAPAQAPHGPGGGRP